MGGVGSGNWYRFDKKTTTGECHSVDVRYLHRERLLKPGRWFSLRWSRAGRETGSISGAVIGNEKPEWVILTYRHRSGPGGEWEEVWEPVPLTWTACNFGGERPWFVCPGDGCGRRVAILYGPGRYFLCRRCYDLVYESQRENEMSRPLRRAQNIRERLGGSANMMQPFPEKPKDRHWQTYERLWWGAPRGGGGAARWYEGVAGQAGEEGRIFPVEGFVWQFWDDPVGDTKALVAGSILAHSCRL